jgi:hypothetical protein
MHLAFAYSHTHHLSVLHTCTPLLRSLGLPYTLTAVDKYALRCMLTYMTYTIMCVTSYPQD